MGERAFVAWVEPVAGDFRAKRDEVIEFARALPAEAWSRPSPDEGWTYHDILAHLAAGTDKQLQAMLRAVVTRTRLDPALFGNADEVNARDVAERRGRSAEQIIAELEADRDEVLDLLSQLKEEDRDLRQKEFTMSLGEVLPNFPTHDVQHLEQLRTALEAR